MNKSIRAFVIGVLTAFLCIVFRDTLGQTLIVNHGVTGFIWAFIITAAIVFAAQQFILHIDKERK